MVSKIVEVAVPCSRSNLFQFPWVLRLEFWSMSAEKAGAMDSLLNWPTVYPVGRLLPGRIAACSPDFSPTCGPRDSQLPLECLGFSRSLKPEPCSPGTSRLPSSSCLGKAILRSATCKARTQG